MDSNTARQILRISPDTPLTAQLIDTAHASETWARHPSRYPDEAGRQQAVEWGTTLDEARAALLAAAGAPLTPPTTAATAQTPRRGLRPWAITGIVAGVVVFVALITFGAFGAAGLVTEAMSTAADSVEAGAEAEEHAASEDSHDPVDSEEPELPDVERFFSGETLYSFPAAVEIYYDGRYDADCSFDFAYGCWQMALFTESGCSTMNVELGYSNDPDGFDPQHTESIDFADVVGNEATVVVFGNDDYDYGWINDVTCLEAAS